VLPPHRDERCVITLQQSRGRLIEGPTQVTRSFNLANRDLEADRLIIEAEFSREFYIAQFASGLDIVDPIRHYLEIGWREYRDPSPSFSTSFYLTEYPDVSQAEINPFVHYIISGRNEGRFASPKDPQRLESQYKYEISIISEYFDQDFYVEQEPSLKDQTRLAMLRHFVEHGWRNHRDPSPDFSTKRYLQLYEDVVTKNVNPFFHYIVAGKSRVMSTWINCGPSPTTKKK
jgi:hypothetical protein